MRIDIQFLPIPPKTSSLSSKTVVVIDVLRATSVIVHAISKGALEIIPVETVEGAFEVLKNFPRGSTLLGGERGSQRIEGFDLGNSPREYTAEKVKGKRLILTTTNGTKAFHSVSLGKEVIAGSFFNIGAMTKWCLDMNQNILLYPAGTGGRFSLEDTICGGMLIDRIMKTAGEPITLTDAAHSAHILYRRFEANLIEAFYISNHGKDLVAKGFEADLAFCAQIDITNIVPTFKEGIIKPI